ncbi:MAG: heparinase II/III family protein [Bryobacteraceae bacterium]
MRDFLLTRTFSYEKNDVGGFLAGAEMATAFDWVYDGLSASDRAAAMANIVTTAESSRHFLIEGQPDINHNYTYMALNTVAVCGLALHGEPKPYGPKATEYLDLAREFLEGRGRVLDTWKAREGAWAEGSHYTFHETVRNLVMMLAAYRSAGDTDYFDVVRQRYGNFLAGTGRFIIDCTRPDMTFVRTGDTSANRVAPNLTVPVTVEALAAGLGVSEDAARLRSFGDAIVETYGDNAVHPFFRWGMRIFSDPSASRTPSYRTLPLALRMGAGTTEHIVFRNGWTPESTHITILAGDHFTDHQHFDTGQFLIYHRGALTVDGGAYDELYKPNGHWNEYADRTIAHNCLLIYDPVQVFPKGYGNDGGQNVLRGLQHHGDWQSYMEHREREQLHAGKVIAYEQDPAGRFDYVGVDLKEAYGNKVSSYDREFVYLPRQDYLVVLDRVRAASADLKQRWLLHFQDEPVIDGSRPQPGVTNFPNAQLTTERRGGALFVHTLLPERHTVTAVGGPGYEYFNSFAGKNYPPVNARTAAEPRESGRWRIEVSPAAPSASTQFLHALEVADGPAKTPVETRLVSDREGQLTGVQLALNVQNQVVAFASALPVSYELEAAAPTEHILVELFPARDVTVAVNGRRVPFQKTGSQGTLVFSDRGLGHRKIVISARRMH